MRSTKVGRLIPTTPSRSRQASKGWSPLNEGREVNPDDTRPRGGPAARDCSLNEGREVNPDDTRTAGPRPARRTALNEGREVNPDDTRDRASMLQMRRRRSTKVGRLIPTTPSPRRSRRSRVRTLNEGREVNPDDTAIFQRHTADWQFDEQWAWKALCRGRETANSGTDPTQKRARCATASPEIAVQMWRFGHTSLNHRRFAALVRAPKAAPDRGLGHGRGAAWSPRCGRRTGTR